ncbi:MAG: ABC transporter permease [Vicinamibacterales bacterium]
MARLPRFLARLVAFPLLLSPKEFRERFGAEVQDGMERGLRDAGQRRGAIAMIGFWGRGMGDALRTAAHERRIAGGDSFWRRSPWSDLRGDVKYALRGWRRSPGFSLAVVTTLALGLGLASAIFSFADGYLFRPLPFPGGDRAYYVRDPHAQIALKASDVVALRGSQVAGYGFVEWSPASLGGELVIGERKVSPLVYEVSLGFSDTLKLPLVAGREFSPEDHLAGAPRVAWLSHRFWRLEFGGDTGAVGRPLRVERNGAVEELRIVGILGPEVASFDLNNSPPDLVVAERGPRRVGANMLSFPLVLLPNGVSVEQASQEISAALQAVAPAADGRPREVRLRALSTAQTAGGRPTAKVLLTGALLVLLLASMNLIHLLLSRSMARAQEVATRASLGASRWRVIRVFLVESLLLGAVGITLGLAVGKALSVLISTNVPQWPTAGRNLALVPMLFDLRVIAIAVLLGIIQCPPFQINSSAVLY